MIPFIVSAFSSEKRFKAIKVKNGYKRTPFFVLFCFFREKKMLRYLGGLYQARATTDDMGGTSKLTVPKFSNISSVTSVNLK